MTTKHFSPELVNQRRMNAVRLRLSGKTVAETARLAELSPPTVSAAWKAFKEGGWSAVAVKPRGRPRNASEQLNESLQHTALALLHEAPIDDQPGWSAPQLALVLSEKSGKPVSRRLVSHWLEQEGLQRKTPLADPTAFSKAQSAYYNDIIAPLWRRLPSAKQRWTGGLRILGKDKLGKNKGYQLYFHGPWNRLYLRCFRQPPVADDYLTALNVLAQTKPCGLAFQGADLTANPHISDWLATQDSFWLVPLPAIFTQ